MIEPAALALQPSPVPITKIRTGVANGAARPTAFVGAFQPVVEPLAPPASGSAIAASLPKLTWPCADIACWP